MDEGAGGPYDVLKGGNEGIIGDWPPRAASCLSIFGVIRSDSFATFSNMEMYFSCLGTGGATDAARAR
jgi:hypothetical protein